MKARPMSLMRELINLFSLPGDLICDPCAGSGTTLVAAACEDRHYVGCELNPEYTAMAERRIRKATELPLFDNAAMKGVE